MTEGPHTIRVEAEDAGGLASAAAIIMLEVEPPFSSNLENRAPTVDLAMLPIRLQRGPSFFGFVAYAWEIDGQRFEEGPGGGGLVRFFGEGRHWVSVVARDERGLESAVASTVVDVLESKR